MNNQYRQEIIDKFAAKNTILGASPYQNIASDAHVNPWVTFSTMVETLPLAFIPLSFQARISLPRRRNVINKQAGKRLPLEPYQMEKPHVKLHRDIAIGFVPFISASRLREQFYTQNQYLRQQVAHLNYVDSCVINEKETVFSHKTIADLFPRRTSAIRTTEYFYSIVDRDKQPLPYDAKMLIRLQSIAIQSISNYILSDKKLDHEAKLEVYKIKTFADPHSLVGSHRKIHAQYLRFADRADRADRAAKKTVANKHFPSCHICSGELTDFAERCIFIGCPEIPNGHLIRVNIIEQSYIYLII
jgi:hypothetical protein